MTRLARHTKCVLDQYNNHHTLPFSYTNYYRNNKEKELIFPILTSPMGELKVFEEEGENEWRNVKESVILWEGIKTRFL